MEEAVVTGQSRQVACGTIKAGRLTLYRINEHGKRVRVTPSEIAAAVKERPVRQRRPAASPVPLTDLARLLGHGDAEGVPSG